ncbi:restriction endonuclease subunit S [Paracidovorax avenae]
MLLSRLDLLATAPGGVAKLRELILTLAVQGKLVPQDPADEPVGGLLQKIRVEKDRLIAEGKIKRDKPLAEIAEEEKPFELPEGWGWARVGELGEVVGGGTPKTDEPKYWASQGIPWLTPADLYGRRDVTVAAGRRDISADGLASSSARVLPAGTVLFSSRAPIGYVAIAANSLATNQGFKSCVPHLAGLSQYLYWNLKQLARKIDSEASGTTFKEISGKDFANVVISLPPLTEQSRIVTRVEALMRLCDALEAKGQLEAAQHAQLVSTLLGTLTASTTPEELAENWQRVAQHFNLLLDRPEAIDALEQTLLQLAVRGLLVPQDLTDEPASALLQKIRTEKDRLIATGQIKRDKPLPPITDEEKPFELPVGWEWVRLGNIFDGGSGTTPLRARTDFFTDGTETWVKTTDLTNGLVTTCEELITKAAVAENRLKYFPAGTVCVAMYGGAGTIGKSGVLGVASTINQSVFALPPVAGIDSEFLHTYVITVRSQWMSFAGGLRKDPNINGQIIKKMVMPVPPLAEQSRIVTRVMALRRLCADLRQRLAGCQSVQARLAEALVQEVA